MLPFPLRILSSWALVIGATACSTGPGTSEPESEGPHPPGSAATTDETPGGLAPGASVAPVSQGSTSPSVNPPLVSPSDVSISPPPSVAPLTSTPDLTDPEPTDTSDDGASGPAATSTPNSSASEMQPPTQTAEAVDETDDAEGENDGSDAEPGVDPEPEPSSPDPTTPTVGLNTGGAGPKKQFEVQFVGNITTRGSVRSDFMNYWDQITPENEGKWDAMEPNRDAMNWGTVDQIYDYAQSNGIPFKGHTLVWGSQEPHWIGGLSEAEQREEVEEWIRLFCERYPAATMIDVVNEPDHRPPTFRQALGGAGSTGYDWIIWSFEKARQHCPNAKLILNDYNVLRYDTENFLKIARVVQDAGYLEAVGCQAHSLEDQTQAELERNLEKIAELGVPIYISEYDIDLADDEQQRAVMERQFTLFYESGWVEGITLWGYIHGSTWVTNSGLIRDNSPRPAMTWLMNYLGR